MLLLIVWSLLFYPTATTATTTSIMAPARLPWIVDLCYRRHVPPEQLPTIDDLATDCASFVETLPARLQLFNPECIAKAIDSERDCLVSRAALLDQLVRPRSARIPGMMSPSELLGDYLFMAIQDANLRHTLTSEETEDKPRFRSLSTEGIYMHYCRSCTVKTPEDLEAQLNIDMEYFEKLARDSQSLLLHTDLDPQFLVFLVGAALRAVFKASSLAGDHGFHDNDLILNRLVELRPQLADRSDAIVSSYMLRHYSAMNSRPYLLEKDDDHHGPCVTMETRMLPKEAQSTREIAGQMDIDWRASWLFSQDCLLAANRPSTVEQWPVSLLKVLLLVCTDNNGSASITESLVHRLNAFNLAWLHSQLQGVINDDLMAIMQNGLQTGWPALDTWFRENQMPPVFTSTLGPYAHDLHGLRLQQRHLPCALFSKTYRYRWLPWNNQHLFHESWRAHGLQDVLHKILQRDFGAGVRQPLDRWLLNEAFWEVDRLHLSLLSNTIYCLFSLFPTLSLTHMYVSLLARFGH